MTERSIFPPSLSDPLSGTAERAAVFVGVPLPSSGASGAPDAHNNLVQAYLGTLAMNAAVPRPASGYGGVFYVIGNRVLREVGRLAAGAMLSLEPTLPSRYRPTPEFMCDSQANWYRALFSQFASVQPYVPCLPLKVVERERVFPPAWKSDPLDQGLTFMFADED